MLVQRMNPSCGVLGAYLYSFGGLRNTIGEPNIERLKVKWCNYEEPANRQWEPVFIEGFE